MWKRALSGFARALGYAVLDTRKWTGGDGIYSLHSPRFRSDARFRSAYARGVQAAGGHDPQFEWRLHFALWAATLAARVAGDFVECGVNAGFLSSAILTWLDWPALDKTFYLIDTFAGPPLDRYSPAEIAAGRLEVAQRALAAGSFVTDLDRIHANYQDWPRVVVVQGAIPEILPAVPRGPVSFLHIDLNCAAPEVAALRFFWERLSPGAVVLLDDYGYTGHDAQGDAIDALARELGTTVAALPTGQGLIVRA